jgi:hypothetical protein
VGWLRRRRDHRQDEPDRQARIAGDQLRCATCGQPLGFDPEDEPEGDAGLPICGECNRSRNFDVMLEFELDRD